MTRPGWLAAEREGVGLKCILFFGDLHCPNEARKRGMCEAHYRRWRSGARGAVLNRGRLLHAKKRPLEKMLKEICRVQAEVITDQWNMLQDAGWIVRFASMAIEEGLVLCTGR